MNRDKVVWSDQHGDMRKSNKKRQDIPVDETKLELMLRRLTSGKGRTCVEITGLPQNSKWCQKMTKELKKSLGVGGTYKKNYIEIHTDKLEKISSYLDSKSLKWKKIGG